MGGRRLVKVGECAACRRFLGVDTRLHLCRSCLDHAAQRMFRLHPTLTALNCQFDLWYPTGAP